MRVWIDHDECAGVGVCVDACPEVFVLASDGLAYVKQNGQILGRDQAAVVDDALYDAVCDAADDCPQDCIYVEA
ncbi:MAG: ferredoxin [Actinomyces sp.]|nr:MAG: ferredoxin [Actinomyces sp.]